MIRGPLKRQISEANTNKPYSNDHRIILHRKNQKVCGTATANDSPSGDVTNTTIRPTKSDMRTLRYKSVDRAAVTDRVLVHNDTVQDCGLCIDGGRLWTVRPINDE